VAAAAVAARPKAATRPAYSLAAAHLPVPPTAARAGYGLDKFVAVGKHGAAQQQLSLNSKSKDARPTKPSIAQELGLDFGGGHAHNKALNQPGWLDKNIGQALGF